VSLGVVILWLAAFVVALGARGVSGKTRLLQFLSPGNVTVAVAILVAVLLIVVHQQRPWSDAHAGPSTAETALLIAVVLAAAKPSTKRPSLTAPRWLATVSSVIPRIKLATPTAAARTTAIRSAVSAVDGPAWASDQGRC
jgi:hypothetical protein